MSAFGRLPFPVALLIAAGVVVAGEALAFASGVPPLSWVAIGAALLLMTFYLVEYSRRPTATVPEAVEEPFDDPVIEAVSVDGRGSSGDPPGPQAEAPAAAVDVPNLPGVPEPGSEPS